MHAEVERVTVATFHGQYRYGPHPNRIVTVEKAFQSYRLIEYENRPGVAARHGNGDISRANDEDDAEEIDADPDADADEDDDIAMHGNAKGHTAPQVSDDDEEEPHAGRVRRASAKQAQRLAEQEAANARKVANAAKVAKKQRIQERGEDPVPQEDTVFTSREVEVPTKKKSLPQRDNRVPRLPAEPTKVRLGMEWPASHCKTFAISSVFGIVLARSY
ncbi:hypothetical protein B0H11DRAFT_1937342 [Mycena galericulata]|nr:hypothetical protein B0H11DRAFT_1937342 [Mycena galericulata]